MVDEMKFALNMLDFWKNFRGGIMLWVCFTFGVEIRGGPVFEAYALKTKQNIYVQNHMRIGEHVV